MRTPENKTLLNAPTKGIPPYITLTHKPTEKCTLQHAALMSHLIKQLNIRGLQRLFSQTVLQIKTDTTATF